MKGPLFYSKILLFGEYGIIKDSKGLSIPYNFYKGALKTSENLSEEAQKSNESLIAFVDHLARLGQEEPHLVEFDIERLKLDCAAGMYFDSSIPQGYGVGSSGALVAAIYDYYALNKITVLENLTREKLLTLKTIFGRWSLFPWKILWARSFEQLFELAYSDQLKRQYRIHQYSLPEPSRERGGVFIG